MSRFDLRFIPDETTFDEDPTDVCKDTPNPDTYKPKTFFNTALMQGNQILLEKWKYLSVMVGMKTIINHFILSK